MPTAPPRPRHVALLVYDGIQILDVTGPAAVFAAANDAAEVEHYRVHILSAAGGLVQSNSAPALASAALLDLAPESVDTVLISGGGPAIAEFVGRADVAAWLRQASAHCRRLGSICTGALGLAQLGLLDGKRVATHWGSCVELAQCFPAVLVDDQSLYVQDGQLWTSAGVTTGIDMCLAMVGADLGEDVANRVARRLVMYSKRPGYQSQFSPVLAAQSAADSPFAELVNWVREHLAEPLDVPRLATRMAMSDRNFHRRFTDKLGETPARFIESLRMDRAKDLLSAGLSLKRVASYTGYANAGQFSKAFERRIGMAPTLFQELHGRRA